ncbi:MAG: 50S ribosomal protein L4 [Chloroflexi bacterium]|nr:50S ribosomal protein L4 [Chloroflexota bacterium]
MKLDVTDPGGKRRRAIEVDDAVFGVEPNVAVVHQTLLAQLAARRAGTASTKSRSEVAGSTRKISRQKGLGAARQGSRRAPHRRGGGVVFGPKPRSFQQRLPKRMRRLAIRSVLSSRVREERLRVVTALRDAGEDAQPSTKSVVRLLEALGVERSALIVTGTPDRSAYLSARNVAGTDVLPADTISVADLLAHHTVVLTVDAVRRCEELWGGERAGGRPQPGHAPGPVGGA